MVGVRRLLLVAFVLFAVPGCLITVDDDDDEGLFVDWTITGDFDPLLCDVFGAFDVEIAVVDLFSNRVDTFYEPCDSFGISLAALPGSYDVELTMLDRRGDPISDTLIDRNVDVFEDEETYVPFDFLSSDFL